MISRQITTIRITVRFLEELWSEIQPATVYLYNRIPHKATGWKSPLEIYNIWLRKHGGNTSLLNDLSNFTHLSIYGCRGYLFNEVQFKDTDRVTRKNWPRIDIGYFIGYKNDNTRRFWVLEAKRIGYVVIEIWDIQVDKTVFYTLKPLQLLQPDPIVEIDSNDDSDTGSIVSISSIADLQPRDDPDDSEEEVDLFVDHPDSPTNKNVYTASENPEILQELLERRYWIRQLSTTARKNLE